MVQDASKSVEGQSQFQNAPQTSETVTQVIGDRYMDPDQLKGFLEKKFAGRYKMQVSQIAHHRVALGEKC